MLTKIYYSLILIYFLNTAGYGQISGSNNQINYSRQSLDDSDNNNYGILNIYAAPNGAEIIINDSLYGKLPLLKTVLRIGDYRIKIIRDECNPVIFDLKLLHSEYTLNVRLENKFGYLIFPDKSLEVAIDGEPADIEDKIKTEPGRKEFTVFDKKDGLRLVGNYFVASDREYIVQLKRKQFDGTNFLISALFPGGGQMLDGAALKGFGIALPFFTSLGLYTYSKMKYNNEFKDYNDKVALYNNYTYTTIYKLDNEIQLADLKKIILKSKDKLNSLSDDQKLFGWISIGIYIFNLADVLMSRTFLDRLEFKSEQYKYPNDEIGYQIKVNYKF